MLLVTFQRSANNIHRMSDLKYPTPTTSTSTAHCPSCTCQADDLTDTDFGLAPVRASVIVPQARAGLPRSAGVPLARGKLLGPRGMPTPVSQPVLPSAMGLSPSPLPSQDLAPSSQTASSSQCVTLPVSDLQSLLEYLKATSSVATPSSIQTQQVPGTKPTVSTSSQSTMGPSGLSIRPAGW